MINLDGSHEAWLIYSDWLEDQDNELCRQIRSDLEDEINNWCYEYRYSGVGGDDEKVGNGVGSVGNVHFGHLGQFVGGVSGASVGGGIAGGIAGGIGGSRKLL
jgi:hypothetical protein